MDLGSLLQVDVIHKMSTGLPELFLKMFVNGKEYTISGTPT
jgi:hypothetical protein